MRKHLQFNLGFFFLVTFVVAICLAKKVSIWVILLSAQVLLIQILVAVLCRSIPHSLTKASRDNCFRIGGSISPRRESRERKALSKIRSDLNAVLIIVALAGNWLVLMIDTLVIPLPLATESLAVFGLTLGWIIGSSVFIRYAYLRTMRDFYAGIMSQSTEYLNLDIGRMQSVSANFLAMLILVVA